MSGRGHEAELPRPELSRAELRRYSRPLLVPEWLDAGAQERVRAATVLVVGAGGLGTPVIAQLAGAGVGALVISEGDRVELSNLHRQTLYAAADVGRLKADVAAARAQAINSHVRVKVAPPLDAGNADALVRAADLVVDATDNFEARYAVADACTRAGREWVWGAAAGTSGMLSVFGPGLGLRDVFPVPEDAESCAEAGVLGPLPNVVGSMMALETLKVLGGVGEALRGRVWTLDALTGRVRTLNLRAATSTPV
ncbi:adenylyltransferase/sulfurtransferase [Deinococcus metalli]|uniref:Adenylyltransferase/sulfurtransferase n=1 Tax=Deinococcus metalli TaxID=1141878 RepID=A0A7W8KBA2_9DEIO|nr:HesA/MoeB/ThiF family protein [Deinococcus metalli]MBB5374563.1 adenylyltransferase/sulfurtransferase [Deinococcus metalli]GHF35345.1 molybdopterin biosynthesis protein MoeB [Deinococcus metalli]